MLVLYTDALTEAFGVDGKVLGEDRLLKIVENLPTGDAREFGSRVLQGVRAFSGGSPAEDDETILVLKFSAARNRTPGVREKLTAYAKLLGLKSI
jgi:serine phosphatase RsbU (regulator of sigma subunit)